MSDGSQRTWLIKQCENLKQHCERRQLATDAEIARVWPDDDADEREWIKAYGQFRAWRWFEELNSGKLDAQDRVRKALLDEPERVLLTDPVERDGKRVYELQVYPKSFACLLWFRERDWTLNWLTNYLSDLKTATAAGSLPDAIQNPDSLRDDIVAEIASQMARIAGVCASPGARLPDPIPAIDDISPVDFYFIHQAFTETNSVRLGALDRIVRPTGGKGDTGWNVFFGTMSQKLDKPAKELMENQSMASLIAEARLAIPDMEDDLAGH